MLFMLTRHAVTIPIEVQEWFSRNYPSVLRIALILLAATLFNRFSSRFIKRLVERTVRPDMHKSAQDRKKRIETLHSISVAAVRFAVWLVAIINIIGLLGINTAPLFASAGLLGAGLAFGSQSLVKDFLSGLFIISENQYRVGDYIDIMEVSGTVEAIGLRTTVLRDVNGNIHHVPNGSIVVTTNRSMGQGHINLDISVEESTDIALLEHVINHAGKRLASSTEYKEDIVEAPHFDRISDYANNAITVKVLGVTNPGKQLRIKSALLGELKRSFSDNRIKIAVLPLANMSQAKKRR